MHTLPVPSVLCAANLPDSHWRYIQVFVRSPGGEFEESNVPRRAAFAALMVNWGDLIRAAAGDTSDDDGRRLERERHVDSAVGTAITLGVPAAGEGGVDQPDNRDGG
jgi:hypothetical protein